MTARDGIGVAVGASLSFSLGLLATEKHPEHVLRWGLGISLAVLAGLWLWEMARGPWISVHVTPGKTVPDGVVLNIGLKNNGSRAADQKIFNLLVPDRFPMFESFENGDQRRDFLIDPRNLNLTQVARFAHVRPLASGASDRMSQIMRRAAQLARASARGLGRGGRGS